MSRRPLPVDPSGAFDLLERFARPAVLLAAWASCFGLTALIAGCQSQSAASPAPSAAAEAPPVNPLAGVDPSDARLVGEVVEVLPTGGYTYFRLADETWAVVMGAGPAVGDRIDARVFAEKRDFRSRRLDRTFAALHFVSLTGG